MPERLLSPHIVVVGGGITGLSAAFYLQRAARSAGRLVHLTLVELEARLGGKIRTDRAGGAGAFLVEGGPDSFITQKPHGLELVRDLGLDDQLIPTNPARHWAYILVNGKPCPLPEGMRLMIPTKMVPFLRSPVLSPRGRLRILLDLVVPPRREPGDESLAAFVRRRFGPEALDRLAEPLLSGIYSADPERQSLLATFPQFAALERRDGSLIRSVRRSASRVNGAGKAPSGAFVSLRGGVGALVTALGEALGDGVLAGRQVAAVEPPSVREPSWRLRLDDGTELRADGVILTTPASTAAELVAPFASSLAAELRAIRSVSTATISLAYRSGDVPKRLDGFGVVVPRSERRQINALTISSAKFAHRAPDGHTLLRVFVGGSRTPELVGLDDAELLTVVRAELRAILGIVVEPEFSRIYRWPNSQPQYDVGHLDRVARIAALCPPGLVLAGSAYGGVGIPDCIRQGREASAQVLAALPQALAVHP